MKKNLFEIKTEEVQRILSLHEERTKSQYLNIMEQSKGTLGSKENPLQDKDLSKDVDVVVDEIDGTVNLENLKMILATLKKYQNKFAVDPTDVTKVKLVPAMYRFRTLYFQDEGEKLIDDINSIGVYTLGKTAQTIKDQIINLINASSKGKTILTNTKPTVAKTQFDIKLNHSFGNGAFKVPATSVAKKFNNDYVVITTPDKKQIWFNCSTKTYSNGGAYVPEDKNATGLSTNLLSATYLCNKPQVSGPPPLDATTPPPTDTQTPPVVDGTQTPPVVDGTQTQPVNANKQQQFVQKTVAAINNVQKTMGNQQTGQFTTKDVDTLLTKLKTK